MHLKSLQYSHMCTHVLPQNCCLQYIIIDNDKYTFNGSEYLNCSPWFSIYKKWTFLKKVCKYFFCDFFSFCNWTNKMVVVHIHFNVFRQPANKSLYRYSVPSMFYIYRCYDFVYIFLWQGKTPAEENGCYDLFPLSVNSIVIQH